MVDTEDCMSDADSSELHELLREHAIPHFDPRVASFWSIQRLRSIMTLDRISDRLECSGMQRDSARITAQQIKVSYMRVFSILTLNQMDDQITTLMNAGLDDNCLPLTKAKTNKMYHWLVLTAGE